MTHPWQMWTHTDGTKTWDEHVRLSITGSVARITASSLALDEGLSTPGPLGLAAVLDGPRRALVMGSAGGPKEGYVGGFRAWHLAIRPRDVARRMGAHSLTAFLEGGGPADNWPDAPVVLVFTRMVRRPDRNRTRIAIRVRLCRAEDCAGLERAAIGLTRELVAASPLRRVGDLPRVVVSAEFAGYDSFFTFDGNGVSASLGFPGEGVLVREMRAVMRRAQGIPGLADPGATVALQYLATSGALGMVLEAAGYGGERVPFVDGPLRLPGNLGPDVPPGDDMPVPD